jgi:tRNA-(ms[2]io[6]A)-hydroxylase
MESEAGHYTLFIGLAEEFFPVNKVRTRWQQWLDYEKEVMEHMERRGDRIH